MAVERTHAIVHYQREDGNYDGWKLKAAGQETAFTGRDAHGAFAWVKVPEGAATIPYTVEKDGAADGPRRTVDLGRTGEVWITQGRDGQSDSNPAPVTPDKTKAVLHYQRADGDYDGWGLHTWTGAAQPTDWSKPLLPVRVDAYGAVYEVPSPRARPPSRTSSTRATRRTCPPTSPSTSPPTATRSGCSAGSPSTCCPPSAAPPTSTSPRPRPSGSTGTPSSGR